MQFRGVPFASLKVFEVGGVAFDEQPFPSIARLKANSIRVRHAIVRTELHKAGPNLASTAGSTDEQRE
eukprot:117260-Prymnesium_polylepis.1